MTMKFYYSGTSPYARKCLVAARELGLMQDLQLVAVATGPTSHDAELMHENPLCKLPTLVVDGRALYDSRVICDYLNDLAQGPLLPKTGDPWAVRTLQALADGMLDAALLMRYEVALRPAEFQWDAWSRGQREKILGAIEYCNRTVGQWSGQVDFGTIGVACALAYLDLRFPELDWRSAHPALGTWMAKFSERPSMLATAFKG